jgi:DNA-binding CsgD family transcriptional regulator
VVAGEALYLSEEQFDVEKATRGVFAKLDQALANGFEGLRAAGSNFGIAAEHRTEFRQHELDLDRALEQKKVIALCAYDLKASSAADVLDVARVHQFSLARRDGEWQFLETPELRQARREIARLSDAIGVLSRPFPGHDKLTRSERVTLAQIVKGATNKEAARELGLSPRTVEFHRANIMQKLGTKNAAELVRKVLDH